MNELKEIAKRSDPVLVEHIEKLLEYAKSGELQGIIHVDLFSGGGANYAWYADETHEQPAIVGSLFGLITALSNNSEGMFKDISRLKELLGE